MSNLKNDILIKWIKNIDLDAPSADFTDTLMEQLQINVELDLASDEPFTDLVNLPDMDNPSSSFSEGIISKLEPKRTTIPFQPIIGKKVVGIFIALMFILVSWSFLTSNTVHSNPSGDSEFEVISNVLSSFLSTFNNESTIIALCIITINLLLGIDFLYKKRHS